MSCTSSPASSAALPLCSASRRTSSATTAKPLPCFPARRAPRGGNLLPRAAGREPRVAAPLREPAHLVGHDREALAVLPGARRLDGGVERQQVGHIGQLARPAPAGPHPPNPSTRE